MRAQDYQGSELMYLTVMDIKMPDLVPTLPSVTSSSNLTFAVIGGGSVSQRYCVGLKALLKDLSGCVP